MGCRQQNGPNGIADGWPSPLFSYCLLGAEIEGREGDIIYFRDFVTGS
jgi:hypothetical protein